MVTPKICHVCGRVRFTSCVSSGVGSLGYVRLSKDSQWGATCSLPAWSLGSSSELPKSYSPSASGRCTVGREMCWAAEPPRAWTTSRYLYWVGDSCQSVCPIWQISFSPSVAQRVVKVRHAEAHSTVPQVGRYTVSVHSRFYSGCLAEKLEQHIVPLGHAMSVARE